MQQNIVSQMQICLVAILGASDQYNHFLTNVDRERSGSVIDNPSLL